MKSSKKNKWITADGNKGKKIRLALIGGGINSSIGPSHLTALNSSGN